MKFTHITISKFKDQSGVTAVLVAIMTSVLLGFAALAIDIGYLYATKNELQNIADAAALAATGKLGQIYSDPDLDIDMATYLCSDSDVAAIKASALDVVGTGKNRAGSKDIDIDTNDIFINHINEDDTDTKFSTSDLNQPNAVRVIARRDSNKNSPVTTFFARIFNIDSLPVRADATAALTGLGNEPADGLPIPIGVSVDMFKGEFCDDPLIFHPTTESCAGWHTYDSKDQIKQIVQGLLDETFESPETSASGEDIYYFNGGTNDATYKVLYDLFEKEKYLDDDEDDTTWTTSIVVFDGPCYTNPVDPYPIVGFASIKIYGVCHSQTVGETYNGEVCLASEEHIVGTLECDLMVPSRGGGGYYGTWGSIPNLVE